MPSPDAECCENLCIDSSMSKNIALPGCESNVHRHTLGEMLLEEFLKLLGIHQSERAISPRNVISATQRDRKGPLTHVLYDF
jgi:hypothetical protein